MMKVISKMTGPSVKLWIADFELRYDPEVLSPIEK